MGVNPAELNEDLEADMRKNIVQRDDGHYELGWPWK